MSELIVASRIMIEGQMEYVYMSRVGVTCFNKDRDLISFVFDPKESSYTVPIADVRTNDVVFNLGHVFVSRYMAWTNLQSPYQVWRWHIDVYPAHTGAPITTGEQLTTKIKGTDIYRSSFEPVCGPSLVDKSLLDMMFSSHSVPTAFCTQDLVPERLEYTNKAEYLPHPGLLDGDLGILAEYENLFANQLVEQPQWVM